jgi:hypothetical protein
MKSDTFDGFSFWPVMWCLLLTAQASSRRCNPPRRPLPGYALG